MKRKSKGKQPQPSKPLQSTTETPPLPFELGPLPSKFDGKVIGHVTYRFQSEQQRETFARGGWPTGIVSPKNEATPLDFDTLLSDLDLAEK